jgi:ankyrin repeat protein
VEWLIERGATLNKAVNGYENMLHWACYFGNRALIKIILDKSVDFMVEQCGSGWFPVDYLFLQNKSEYMKYKAHNN